MLQLLSYRGSLFQSSDWFRLLATTTDVEPVVFATHEAALPCRRQGRHLESLTNFYTLEYAPVGPFEGLLEYAGPRIDLRYLKDESLEERIRDAGYRTFRYHLYANWTCRIVGGFQAYMAERPSKLRNTIKRRSRALLKEHQVDLKILTEPCADFVDVYNESWKNPEPFPDFIPGLMALASRLGILRLGVAYIDGVPAAAQLWLVESGKATIYKLAYKERFKATSIGSILSHELFRHAIDVDGVEVIDYGVGDEPYKRDWMTERSEVFGLLCLHRRSARATAEAAIESAKRLAKRAIRR